MNSPAKRYSRLTDSDRSWGPFDLGARDPQWRPLSVVLDSGDGDEHPGCALMLRAFGWTLRVRLPQIIQPYREWIDTSKDAWANGRKGFWDSHPNEYGFRCSDGFFQLFLGPQTNDSTTTKSWSKFLPWTQWRHVRYSLYGLSGEHFYTELDATCARGIERYNAQEKARHGVAKAVFSIVDFDGQRIRVTTYIEEREWLKGTGSFKWLSWFVRPMVKRSLDLSFDKELGPEKGSWKGGTLGHSITMLPGELHEAAMRRYCDLEHRSRGGRFRITFGAREQ